MTKFGQNCAFGRKKVGHPFCPKFLETKLYFSVFWKEKKKLGKGNLKNREFNC